MAVVCEIGTSQFGLSFALYRSALKLEMCVLHRWLSQPATSAQRMVLLLMERPVPTGVLKSFSDFHVICPLTAMATLSVPVSASPRQLEPSESISSESLRSGSGPSLSSGRVTPADAKLHPLPASSLASSSRWLVP
ncbi:hypothetical protein [Streptomyces sp. NPDC013489]|uniref:hypothetical protein n=1 Tax=Streptomyces sp. NPDC013489 TaxID=3155606 RepID=UPI0033CB4D08